MRVEPPALAGPRIATVLVISNGWHTHLALPARDATGPLIVFRQDFPDARWLAFGWGERTFFMSRHPDAADALRAVFPAPSALLVTGFAREPAAGPDVLPVRVSRAGLAHLSTYLWGYVRTSPDGMPQRLGNGAQPTSAFYASTGTYDLFHTCNTWVAAALYAAGVPVDVTGVVTAGQIMGQVRRLDRTPGASLR